MTHDSHKLTPTELHAVQALVAAVKSGNDEEARWWIERAEIFTALAKMRAQTKREAS
jgi:DUF438 domain-containing protein